MSQSHLDSSVVPVHPIAQNLNGYTVNLQLLNCDVNLLINCVHYEHLTSGTH